jgi:hypothetical protein
MEMYKCVCGREFMNAQQFNGHKSHCKTYQLDKYGNLDVYNKVKSAFSSGASISRKRQSEKAKEKRKTLAQKWIDEKHRCEKCGRVMTVFYGSGRFCSRSCANTRQHSEETKAKIGKSGLNRVYKRDISKNIISYERNPNRCTQCGKALSYNMRFRKTCSDECLHTLRSELGKKLVALQNLRSKNEIAFCQLCEQYFGKENVLHNAVMFNGWDADIIIPSLKVAILWNGPWHYIEISKTQKLKQVQNRDRIKLREIINCGYRPYIIEDVKREKDKVEKEFERFKKRYCF